MYPLLRDEDFVVVKKAPPDLLQRGNILVYQTKDGKYLAHRLISKGDGKVLHLKGDGYNLPSEFTESDAVLGKAAGFIREGRYRPLGRIRELHSWYTSLLKEHAKRFVRSFFPREKGFKSS